jgi:hypothetical protein
MLKQIPTNERRSRRQNIKIKREQRRKNESSGKL